jgi:hypothetical protein
MPVGVNSLSKALKLACQRLKPQELKPKMKEEGNRLEVRRKVRAAERRHKVKPTKEEDGG